MPTSRIGVFSDSKTNFLLIMVDSRCHLMTLLPTMNQVIIYLIPQLYSGFNSHVRWVLQHGTPWCPKGKMVSQLFESPPNSLIHICKYYLTNKISDIIIFKPSFRFHPSSILIFYVHCIFINIPPNELGSSSSRPPLGISVVM